MTKKKQDGKKLKEFVDELVEPEIIVEDKTITIDVGGTKLELLKETLREHNGVHKAVINHVAPFVKKALNEQI